MGSLRSTSGFLNSTSLPADVTRLCRFLCPWEKMDAESRAALPGALRESLEKEGAALTGHAAWRSPKIPKGWATGPGVPCGLPR